MISGFTSWSEYSPYINSLEDNQLRKYYVVEIFNYIHHVVFTLIGGWAFTLKFAPFLDNLIIFSTAVIFAEVVGEILFHEKK